MKYFETLPTIIAKDPRGNSIVASNLLARVSFVSNLIQDPELFYLYDIRDGDTPESVSNKYYNDPYKYWLILLSNQMFDANWDWPISQKLFFPYLTDKYSAASASNNMTTLAYTQSTIKLYRKVITTIDGQSSTPTTQKYIIDANSYNNLIVTTKTGVSSLGFTITQQTTKEFLSIYDWETEQNENKRSIQLINAAYVNKIEKQFDSLMNR